MKRKLFMFAVLVGVCSFNLADRLPSATASSLAVTPGAGEAFVQWLSGEGAGYSPPLCNSGWCATHQDLACTCPEGTVREYQLGPCDTWRIDCNAL
ncbi:MAG TPA: hypothetical protein VHG32_13490 [Thermoanaerobaculia bacterium]|jgi:hypothetical protein|nr:hypothetical protein [Thermoanaerobaculia bacterium]